MKTSSFAFALLTIITASATLASENWPQWRGPRGDGHSAETGLPTHWSEQQAIAWKAPLPAWGTSTPAIWDDAVFVTSQQDDQLLALRLNRHDGAEVWRRQVGQADTVREAEKRSVQKFHRLHNNASPSPTTDGEVAVFHFGNGDLAVYDFAGQRLWQRNLQTDYGTYTIWWGHANSPVLVGDLVISVCMQDSLDGVSEQLVSSYLVAHDKRTGREVWKTLRMTGAEAEQCDSYTTPVLATIEGQPRLIIMGGNQLDAYDPSTGQRDWHLPGLVGGRTITGPVVAGERVYTTIGMRGDMLAVPLSGQGERRRDEVLWRHGESTPDTCCPVVVDGKLFTVSDNGIAQCLDVATGRPLWRERLPGDYKASPVVAEGRVYFLNTRGLCSVVAAVGTFQLLAENQLDDETIASPAIAHGALFIRGREHLYCLRLP